MPKITKCLKCLKLQYSVDFNKFVLNKPQRIRKMKTTSSIKNETGSIVVAGLMVLILLTVIGISASNLATTEMQTSTNSLLYERAFYTAEAGLAHAKELLKIKYFFYNEAAILSGGDGEWDFALDGTELGAGTAATDTLNDTIPDYAGGVVWIDSFDLNGVAYNGMVEKWNIG